MVAIKQEPHDSTEEDAPEEKGKELLHLTCHLCPTIVFGDDRLHFERHVGDHLAAGEPPYRCPYCAKELRSTYHLNRHALRHRDERDFACDSCGKRFKSDEQLKRHAKTVHDDRKRFECPVCGKRFRTSTAKTTHGYIHTEERAYRCDTCGKSFKNTDNLRKHRLVHVAEKKAICQLCGKGFVAPHKLRRHVESHQRKYRCEACHREYKQKTAFDRHVCEDRLKKLI